MNTELPSEEKKRSAGFTLKDLASLRWLAVGLGAVLLGFGLVSKGSGEVMLLAIGMAVAVMILAPLAIYGLRKLKGGKGRE